MAAPELNTGDYPDDDRLRLGEAIRRAREAAGMARRKDLAQRAQVSLRSVAKLESPIGEMPVGRKVLEAVARVLPGWSPDTPRDVLEGGDPPSPTEPSSEGSGMAELPEDEQQFVDDLIDLDFTPEQIIDKLRRLRVRKRSRDVTSPTRGGDSA